MAPEIPAEETEEIPALLVVVGLQGGPVHLAPRIAMVLRLWLLHWLMLWLWVEAQVLKLLCQGPLRADEGALGEVTGQASHDDLLDHLHVIIDKLTSGYDDS